MTAALLECLLQRHYRSVWIETGDCRAGRIRTRCCCCLRRVPDTGVNHETRSFYSRQNSVRLYGEFSHHFSDDVDFGVV